MSQKEIKGAKSTYRRRRKARQRAARVLFIAGAALIVVALSFLLRGMILANRAGDASGEIVELMLAGYGEMDDDGLLIEDCYYIGCLNVPDLDIILPVMKDCSLDNLAIAPCRYYGSVETGDLVIAGHNYLRHFGPIKSAPVGTEVIFTDIWGTSYYYEISETVRVLPTQIEKMIGSGEDHDWEMTLFTCTPGGNARCAIRCVRTDK